MRVSQDNKLRAKLLAAGKDFFDPKLDAPRVLWGLNIHGVKASNISDEQQTR